MKFTPLDLVASAYNSCMLGTMEHIAKQNKFEIGETKSQIEWALSEDTTRIGSMDIQISFANDFSEEQKETIKQLSKLKQGLYIQENNTVNQEFKGEY